MSPTPADCNLQTTCTLKAPNELVAACGNQQSQYLYGIYRFLPIASSTKYSQCDLTDIDVDNNPFGVITSRNYPKWEPNVDCVRRLITRNPSKTIKFYITDIDIEDEQMSTQK